MGCATSNSKFDDSPAVTLCRDRCALLDHALRHRFTFAHSHAAFLLSLKSVGLSLHHFFLAHSHDHLRSTTSSPALNDLHSHSGSQDDDSHGGGAARFMHLNFIKTQTTSSNLHTQQPMVAETMYTDEFPALSSSYNPYPNFANDNNQNYGAGGGVHNGASPPAPAYNGDTLASPTVPSSSNRPSSPPLPPPPPPPRSSTWDFLNPFDIVESYYPAHTQSHDSREIREAEGIPDLEDEVDEVGKVIHSDQRFVGGGGSGIHSKPGTHADFQVAKHTAGMERDIMEYEVHLGHKNADDAKERLKIGANASGFKPSKGFKGEMEVVREIQVQFKRASDSASELAKFLEAGKLQYNGRHSSNQNKHQSVSSKLLHSPVSSCLPSLPIRIGNTDPSILDIDEDAELRTINQSSTLHKLYLWEKKLYQEIKVEEKMRVLHEGKSRKLKHLDESGAEALKVDATRNLVRSLSTKIKIAMQVVDKISVKINNLRDEELWPQLHELIQGLTRMWKSMLECHRNQCQAIGEAKRLDDIAAFHRHFDDAHFEATRQLGHDLINWTIGFASWITAQKDYIRAMNNWLMKCLLYVPEETADGLAPFSPTRIGAPPVFVVCNQWSKSLDRISEKEVIDSIRDFASNVLLLWDREKAAMQQKMLLENQDDRTKKIKNLEKEKQKIQKEIQALDKRIILISTINNGMPVSGHAETTGGGNLQTSLQRVLGALEKYAASSLKVYEELLQLA